VIGDQLGGRAMADATANLKKAQNDLETSKKAYEKLEKELETAMKKWLALSDDEKRIDDLKHVGELVRKTEKAGDDYLADKAKMAKAAKQIS
jgi:hypothetical protein